jgi:hypothetical protein
VFKVKERGIYYADDSGKSDHAFTARVCELFKQSLGIEGVHVYTTFQTINQWGWDGKIL